MSVADSDVAAGDGEGAGPLDGRIMALNPFEPGFFADPYVHYARARDAARLHHTPVGVVVPRYEDCFAVLRAPGMSVDEARAVTSIPFPRPEAIDGREERMSRAMLNVDPPDHTRIRRLVSSAFTVRRVERLRDRVRELVAGLLDEVAAAGAGGEPVDLIGHLAFPLPFQVITDMLGMPEGDRDQLRTWSHTLTRFLEPLTTPDQARQALEASDHMERHLLDAIEWKRRNPADDLLSALIAAEEDGDRLTAAELVDQVRLLYIAGHETTVNLIGNGTLALLRHPDEMARLVADPGLDANAVDELLRYDSPVQLSRRIATTDVELAGEVLPAGTLFLTLLGGANRDPARWGRSADELDLGRPGAAAHLSFGSGVHHCLGAALARLEGAEAVTALVRRFPAMELATDEPDWNGRMVLRGLDTLPVALAA
ncbi:MAG TPA: cytochrome P450 [Acidimicrobiales bacterium]